MEYSLITETPQGEGYDLSDLVIEVKWRTELLDQAGELQFSYLDQEGLKLKEGSAVYFKIKDDQYGEKVIFRGIVVNRSWEAMNGKNALSQIKVVCYDLLWFLRGKYTGKISQSNPMNPAGLFNDVCKRILKDSNLYRVSPEAANINIQLTSEIKDTEPGADVLTKMCKQVLVKTKGKDFLYYYDEGGKIVLDRIPTITPGVKSLEEDPQFKDMLIFGDKSGIINFKLTSTISDAAYNRVFLYSERKDSKRIEVIAENKASQKLFGEISYVEKISTNLTQAQLQELANNKLELFSMPKIIVEMECIGELFNMGKVLRAGSVVSIDLKYLKEKEKISNDQLFLVSQIEHTFSYKKHTMDLTIDSFKSSDLSIGNI